MKRNKRGFTLVEIMIVVAIIGLIAAIAIPNFIRARRTAQGQGCAQNLEQIDGAKQQWGFENDQGDAALPVAADLLPYLSSPAFPACPATGVYVIGALSAAPVCPNAVGPGNHAME